MAKSQLGETAAGRVGIKEVQDAANGFDYLSWLWQLGKSGLEGLESEGENWRVKVRIGGRRHGWN